MTNPSLLTGNDPLTGYDSEAVQAACESIRTYCGWHIAPSITETVKIIRPCRRVRLRSLQVTAVSAVTLAGVPVFGYEWDPEGWLELPLWSLGAGPLLVTMTHGHTVCPLDVRGIVGRMARPGFAPQRVRTEVEGPYSTTYFDNNQSAGDYAADLAAYRLPPVA